MVVIVGRCPRPRGKLYSYDDQSLLADRHSEQARKRCQRDHRKRRISVAGKLFVAKSSWTFGELLGQVQQCCSGSSCYIPKPHT